MSTAASQMGRSTVNTPSTGTPEQPVALLQEAPLRELIAARVVSRVCAVGGHGGFILEIEFGEGKAQLATSRGNARVFASISAIATLMQRLGQTRFEVDIADYVPGRVRAPQPKRSASMKAGRLPKASRKSAKPSK